MLVYPSGLDVSTRHLTLLTTALRQRREQLGTRWRKLVLRVVSCLTVGGLGRWRYGESFRSGVDAA